MKRAPLLFLGLCLCCLTETAGATVWTVTTTADSGPGSLRLAIDSVNLTIGPDRDTISFAIPGAGLHVITVSTALSAITKKGATLDGYSQSGSVANSLVSGDNAVINIAISPAVSLTLTGIDITADSCTVRGLNLRGWNIPIRLLGPAQGSRIVGNFIGVNNTGTAKVYNQLGIVVNGSSNNVMGGRLPSERNIISGNDWGIELFGPASGNVIRGNYFGTDHSGTVELGNNAGDIVLSDADSNVIGDTTSSIHNVICAALFGIYFQSGSSGNVIQGNLIGTDPTGVTQVGGLSGGIKLVDSPDNLIGGSLPGARNVISAAFAVELELAGASVHNRVVGNFIGTDATGLATLPFCTQGCLLTDADSNLIGGSLALDHNVIATGTGAPVVLTGNANANTIAGNYIGVATDGTSPLANGGAGISIEDASSSNRIGSLGPDSANIIANTTGMGVRVKSVATNNRILNNHIFNNTGLGIDLEPTGVTANDPGDGDAGPNGLQNYPVLTESKNTRRGTCLAGTLNSQASTAYYIQVYASPAADPSGYGEGSTLIDSFTVTTNASGNVNFHHHLAVNEPDGTALSATATSPSGSTSEFSLCVAPVLSTVDDTLRLALFSPVDMVVTDPVGDSIGLGFNTIVDSSGYDTTSNVGGDLDLDDVITIAHPITGPYRVRIMPEAGAPGSATFTLSIRIDGNQQLIPEGYQDATVSSLGGVLPDTLHWVAAKTCAGDVNADSIFTSSDIIYMVNYIFKGGLGPKVPGHADANCDDQSTSADIIRMVNFVFKGGVPPCSHSAEG